MQGGWSSIACHREEVVYPVQVTRLYKWLTKGQKQTDYGLCRLQGRRNCLS